MHHTDLIFGGYSVSGVVGDNNTREVLHVEHSKGTGSGQMEFLSCLEGMLKLATINIEMETKKWHPENGTEKWYHKGASDLNFP